MSEGNQNPNKTEHYFSSSFRSGVSFGSFLSICNHPVIMTAIGVALPNIKNDHDTIHAILATSLAAGMPYLLKDNDEIPATVAGEAAGFLFAIALQEVSPIFKPSNQVGAYLSIGIWYYRAEIFGKSAIGSFINNETSQLNEEYPLLEL